MLVAARLVLRQHRFEVGAAALVALALGAWALVVDFRLDALDVPSGCFELWRASGPDGAGDCAGPMRAWSSILAEEGVRIVGAMAYIPFAVGLLGGVPIVARELESRTAQTAWSLNASRLRWLVRQAVPIMILLGVAITFAGLGAAVLQAHREAGWGEPAFVSLGLHGPLVTVRAFAAFGVGLLVGAMLGRTLPAFVFGAVLMLALVFLVSSARDAWLASLEPVPLATPTAGGQYGIPPGVVVTAIGWVAPDGALLSRDEARALATEAGVPPPAANDVQDLPALAWYEEHGYLEVPLGVSEDTALGWGTYDALFFAMAGAASLAATVPLVNRRRPA